MEKEAQLVCIHSSFSKSFEIVSTRKLEQYWLSPQAFVTVHSNNKKLPLGDGGDGGGGGAGVNFLRGMKKKSFEGVKCK
jgi:hypothetical protein